MFCYTLVPTMPAPLGQLRAFSGGMGYDWVGAAAFFGLLFVRRFHSLCYLLMRRWLRLIVRGLVCVGHCRCLSARETAGRFHRHRFRSSNGDLISQVPVFMHCLAPRFRIRRSLERIFRVDVHSGKKVAPLHGVPSCFHETRAVWCLCSWQDMCAMHDLGVSDGKGNPSWQDYRSVYSQMAVCRAYRIHSVQILPKPAHFGYIAAICCQEGAFFLSEVQFGIHQAKNLPPLSIRECIS